MLTGSAVGFTVWRLTRGKPQVILSTAPEAKDAGGNPVYLSKQGP